MTYKEGSRGEGYCWLLNDIKLKISIDWSITFSEASKQDMEYYTEVLPKYQFGVVKKWQRDADYYDWQQHDILPQSNEGMNLFFQLALLEISIYYRLSYDNQIMIYF